MENSEIETHLETIDFYIKESEQFREDLELTDAKYFPKKVEWLVKSYKECVHRILFECRITLSVSQDTISLSSKQQAALWSIQQIREVYEGIDKDINRPPV